MRYIYLLMTFSVLATIHNPPHRKAIVPSSPEMRSELIFKAKTSNDELIEEKRSLLKGPKQKKKKLRFKLNEVVKCQYMHPRTIKQPGGKTPKFKCLYKGKDLKIKYQGLRERNDGIWGETLSTRLFWALGYPADAIYPVRVECDGCPEKPWRHYLAYYNIQKLEKLKETLAAEGKVLFPQNLNKLLDAQSKYEALEATRQTRVFKHAVIERKFPAPRMELYGHQGWNWDEFKRANKDVRAQRDALALLSAFIQHADNKAEQQRLVCLDKDAKDREGTVGSCAHPYLMVQDLGFSFGFGWVLTGPDPKVPGRMLGRGTTAHLEDFMKAPIWSDPKKCITQINYFTPTGMPANQPISEAGRALLAAQLEEFISDDQKVLDLFTAARVEEFAIKTPSGGRITYSVEAWAEAFKERAKKIINHRCPLP